MSHPGPASHLISVTALRDPNKSFLLPQNPTHPNVYAQVALNLEQAADSPGSFVMTQIAGPTPELLSQ